MVLFYFSFPYKQCRVDLKCTFFQKWIIYLKSKNRKCEHSDVSNITAYFCHKSDGIPKFYTLCNLRYQTMTGSLNIVVNVFCQIQKD